MQTENEILIMNRKFMKRHITFPNLSHLLSAIMIRISLSISEGTEKKLCSKCKYDCIKFY